MIRLVGYALCDFLITIAVLGPFFAFFIALILLRGRQERRRRARFTAFAKEHGLEYSTEDPFGLVYERFRVFRRGEERRCTNVLWGEWKGLRVRYADYEYWLRGRRANTAYRSIVLFDPIGAPSTSIRRENILTRAADAAGVEDIDFESEEFNREYRVSSDDPRFARATSRRPDDAMAPRRSEAHRVRAPRLKGAPVLPPVHGPEGPGLVPRQGGRVPRPHPPDGFERVPKPDT